MSEVTVPTMSEHDARRLTERIRIAGVNYTDAKDKLVRLLHEAKAGSAHTALGYASWTTWLSETLGDEPMRLARDERKEVVQLLSSEGMSTRAIAPIVGADHATIARDVQSVANATDMPRTVESMDGIARTFQPQPEPATPKRPPLPEQFFNTIYDLTRNLDRLKKLTEDDRYPSNKEKVALKHESDLQRLAVTLSEVLQTMNNN